MRNANQAQIDAEDGEIDDAKMTDAPRTNVADNQDNSIPEPFSNREHLLSETRQFEHLQDEEVSSKGASRSQTPNQSLSQPEVGSVLSVAAPPTVTPQSDPKSSPSASTGRPPSIPPRPVTERSSSVNAVNSRLPHTLPNRPEPPYSRKSDNRMPERVADRGLRDHSRDMHHHDRNGVDKPLDLMHERPAERHTSGGQPRGHEVPNERNYNTERNRTSSGWGGDYPPGRLSADERHGSVNNRESRPPPLQDERKEWSSRVRSFGESSNFPGAPGTQGPPLRDQAMAPPRSTIPQHPDRAALIHGGQDRDKASFNHPHSDRRHEGNRYDRHASSERSSRGPSPSRHEDRRPPRHDGRHDDRQPNDMHQIANDIPHGHAARYEGNRLPTGPRTDRIAAQGSHDRFRESPKNAPTVSPANEQNRRLIQDSNYSNRQQESQYGRLNPGPELATSRANTGSDVPSGPRLPNGNNAPAMRANGRSFSGAHSQGSPQQAQHPSAIASNVLPMQDRQAPTGPSSRGPPRNSLPAPRIDTAQSASTTQSTESPDTAGVHPDRLRAIQGAANSLPSNVPQSSNTMGRPPRPPLPPVSVPPPMANRPPHGQLGSPGGPTLSPAGPMSATMGPSPTGRGPPTGPSSVTDRSRGDRRMFAGLQNVLQQAGSPNAPERSSQGASIRGRGGRANNMPMHSPSMSGPPTPSMPRFEQRGGDLLINRNGGPLAPSEDDGAYNHGARRGPPRDATRDFSRDLARDGEREMVRDSEKERELMRDEAREGERRSGRLRSSRDPSRDPGHGPVMPLRDNDRPPRRDDVRDRGSGRQPMPPSSERDTRRPPRGDEQRRAESDRREMEEWGPDRRGGMDRRDDRDRREGGGGGRKRGRTGDDGRVHDEKRQRRIN